MRFALLTILSAVVLFGSLIATIHTEDVTYFVFGYPVAALLLFVAWKVKGE